MLLPHSTIQNHIHSAHTDKAKRDNDKNNAKTHTHTASQKDEQTSLASNGTAAATEKKKT